MYACKCKHVSMRRGAYDPVWCGVCYEVARARRERRGPRSDPRVREWRTCKVAEHLRRAARVDGRAGSPVAVEWCDFARSYPALAEFLCVAEWGPGEGRTTGTLLLCVDGGAWKAWLNDRDSGRAAWLSSSTLTGLLDAVEAGIRTDVLDWRAVLARNHQKGRSRG